MCGKFDSLSGFSNNVCVPKKIEDLGLCVFTMITGKNESKTLTKHISYKCKCRFGGKNLIRINGVIMLNVDMNIKTIMYVKKIMFGILQHVIVKMENIYQVLWMIHQLNVKKL